MFGSEVCEADIAVVFHDVVWLWEWCTSVCEAFVNKFSVEVSSVYSHIIIGVLGVREFGEVVVWVSDVCGGDSCGSVQFEVWCDDCSVNGEFAVDCSSHRLLYGVYPYRYYALWLVFDGFIMDWGDIWV